MSSVPSEDRRTCSEDFLSRWSAVLVGGAALQAAHMLFAKTTHVDPAISGQLMASDVSVVNLDTHLIIRAALKDMKGK